MVGLERMKFFDPLRFSSTIHFVESVQSLHTQTHPYVGTHAPLRSIICTTCVHTHTHSPAHPYTHSYHTYTRTPLQQYMHHLCTPLHLLTNIYKYQAYNCHNAYLQICANIHTVTLQYLSFKCLLIFFIVVYLIYCYNILDDIPMDYNDHIDNSDEDHSYDVENDEYDDEETYEYDDEELYDLVVAGCHVAVTYYMKYIDKQHCRDFEQIGYMWLMDCLMGNETKCYKMFRIKPHVFLQLCNVLHHTYGLQHTRHIRLEESVGICLMILGQGACYRMVQERFQHSGETIHRHFHRVLKRLNIISIDILKPFDPTFSVVPRHI